MGGREIVIQRYGLLAYWFGFIQPLQVIGEMIFDRIGKGKIGVGQGKM